MALEDLTGTDKFIDDLAAANPAAGDDVSEGDDHIRGIKNVLKNTFPSVTGAVTSTHTNIDSAVTHSQAAHAPAGAEANVQSDWTQATTTSDDFIKNKPNPAAITDVNGTPTLATGITQAEVRTAIDAAQDSHAHSEVSTSANGFAPQLPAAHGGKFLKADGTWEVPPNTDTKWDGGSTGLAASTGRTSLGLGDSATKNTGTASGTVCAGDDGRLSDSRTPSDNSVTNAKMADDAVGSNEIVANAVGASELNVTGNGTSGQMLTSDGDGTMSWADAGGGGHTIGSTTYWSSYVWSDTYALSGTNTTNVPSNGVVVQLQSNETNYNHGMRIRHRVQYKTFS